MEKESMGKKSRLQRIQGLLHTDGVPDTHLVLVLHLVEYIEISLEHV